MISVVHELLRGKQNVARKFKKAHMYWKQFHKDHKTDTLDELASALSVAQFALERRFDGDQSMAKGVMVVTCLGALWDEANGFKDIEKIGRASCRERVCWIV